MGLTPSTYITLLTSEAREVQTPPGPYRLVATRSRIEDAIASVRNRISRQINGSPESQDDPQPKRLDESSEMAIELSSYLYAAGAPHPQWRRWSALAALGLALQGDIPAAGMYAAIAGEWALVEQLRSRPPRSPSVPRQLWQLLSGTSPQESSADGDDLDAIWHDLVVAVHIGDMVRIERALCDLVQWWWEEDEGDWVNYHPYSYPDYDAPLCAAAAIAKHRGYVPQNLPPDVMRYLEAGLADGLPDPLYPTYSPFPGTTEDT